MTMSDGKFDGQIQRQFIIQSGEVYHYYLSMNEDDEEEEAESPKSPDLVESPESPDPEQGEDDE